MKEVAFRESLHLLEKFTQKSLYLESNRRI